MCFLVEMSRLDAGKREENSMKNRKAVFAAGLCAAMVLAGCGEAQGNNETVVNAQVQENVGGESTDAPETENGTADGVAEEGQENTEATETEGAEAEVAETAAVESKGYFPASAEWEGADTKNGPVQIADVFLDNEMTFGEVADRIHDSEVSERFTWTISETEYAAADFTSASDIATGKKMVLSYVNEAGTQLFTMEFFNEASDTWSTQNVDYMIIKRNFDVEDFTDFYCTIRCIDGRCEADIMELDSKSASQLAGEYMSGWNNRVGLEQVVGIDGQLYGDIYYSGKPCYEFYFEFGDGGTGAMLRFAYLEKQYQ